MARTHCYCGDKLIARTGKCKNECSPYAAPSWLRKQDLAVEARERHRRREERWSITDDDLHRMRRAMRAMDPVTRHVSARARTAAYRSHAAGARR